MLQSTTNDIVNKNSTKDINMNMRRVIMAADAKDLQDYITLHDLQTRLEPSAYTDTTNASNITTGTLNSSLLPFPTITTLGGVKALNQVAHKFVYGLDIKGNLLIAQPDFSDLTGLIAASQIPAALKPPSTQSIPSRALNTVYQNTSVSPRYVTVCVNVFAAAGPVNGRVDFYSDGSATPGTLITSMFNSLANQIFFSVTFIVLPNNFYRAVLTSGNGFVNSWTEWN